MNDCLVFTSRLRRKHSYGDHCLEIMAPKFTLMLCAYGFWAEMIFTVQWYTLLHGRLRLLTGSNPYSNLCLFVCSFTFHSRIFTHMETWPSSIKSFKFWPNSIFSTQGHWAVNYLACHTYCDTGQPFIMDI